mmetsp:Transcript_67279/g.154156  ORF Transcript_67279/g.154156 Transcript_67279/m.154156 type:complete len:240 (-) Transcript_67279:571-1290(-)
MDILPPDGSNRLQTRSSQSDDISKEDIGNNLTGTARIALSRSTEHPPAHTITWIACQIDLIGTNPLDTNNPPKQIWLMSGPCHHDVGDAGNDLHRKDACGKSQTQASVENRNGIRACQATSPSTGPCWSEKLRGRVGLSNSTQSHVISVCVVLHPRWHLLKHQIGPDSLVAQWNSSRAKPVQEPIFVCVSVSQPCLWTTAQVQTSVVDNPKITLSKVPGYDSELVIDMQMRHIAKNVHP